MGKKMKPKGRNPRKVHSRVPAEPVQLNMEPSDQKEGGGTEAEKDRKPHCGHYSKGAAELNRILSLILLSKDVAACEHCREEIPSRRGGKEKGRQPKRKGGTKPELQFIWICLDCSSHFCGGVMQDSVPYGHARRHSKQDHHYWVVRSDNPSICWCFSCNSRVHVELPNVSDEKAELKSMKDDKVVENGITSLASDFIVTKGYIIRGLSNLGNTCFFNSVMQNLLALDILRDLIINLHKPTGPLTISLKKLFVETSGETNTKGVLNPKNIFGCICSKAPQFRGYQQQDSHELLRCLLDGLQVEEMNARKVQCSYYGHDERNTNTGGTVVDVIFSGQLSSTICCTECGHTSVVHEPFLDLSLPVPSKNAKQVPFPSPKKGKSLSLKERNKSQRFQGKKGVKGPSIIEQQRTDESTSSQLEQGEASCSASKAEATVALKVEELLKGVDLRAEKLTENDQKHVAMAPKLQQSNNSEACEFTCMNFLDGPSVVNDSSWMDYLGEQSAMDDVANMNDEAWSDSVVQSSADDPIFPENDKKHVDIAPKLQESNNSGACELTRMDYLDGPSVVNDSSWMDFLGEQSVIDDVANMNDEAWSDSAAQSFADPICHGKNDLHSSSDIKINISSKEPADSSDSLPEESSSSGTSSHAQDSGVILLPYEELNPKTEEAITVFSCSQHPENMSSTDNLVSYSNNPPIPASEQSEADFDGFGDLFNEPEVTSTDTGTSGGVDLVIWESNSDELNQEEVDNSDAPVSIHNCLALFTKPELLCGEHAWYCDHCSLILSPRGTTRDKSPSTTVVVQLEEKPQSDRSQCNRKSLSSSVLMDCLRPTSSKTSEDAEIASVFIKADSHTERPDEKSINTLGNSKDIRYEDGEENVEGSLDFPGSSSSDQALKTDVLEDQEFADLRSGTGTLQDVSNINSAIRGREHIGSSEQALAACMGHQDPTQTGLSDSSRKVKLEVNHVRHNGDKLAQGRGNKIKEDNTEEKKVKRDATKRYLISKTPSILTIHLKRFSQDARGRLTKLRGHVGFVEMLDLQPYMDPRCDNRDKCTYRLVGVVEHSGSMGGGHYVAYVRGEHHGLKIQKDANSSSWFYANDAHVRQTSLSEVLKSDAYLLFYEKM